MENHRKIVHGSLDDVTNLKKDQKLMYLEQTIQVDTDVVVRRGRGQTVETYLDTHDGRKYYIISRTDAHSSPRKTPEQRIKKIGLAKEAEEIILKAFHEKEIFPQDIKQIQNTIKRNSVLQMKPEQQAETIKGLINRSSVPIDIGDQIVTLIKIKSNNLDNEVIAAWFETFLRLCQQMSEHLGESDKVNQSLAENQKVTMKKSASEVMHKLHRLVNNT